MSAREIFYEIAGELGNAERNKIPISNFLWKYQFEECDRINPEEVYRMRLREGADEVIVYIISINHDKTGCLNPDTNHNYIELYEKGIYIEGRHYMYND